MATVRMRKGGKYADVFDSPETIRQAQFEGYSLVEGDVRTTGGAPAGRKGRGVPDGGMREPEK